MSDHNHHTDSNHADSHDSHSGVTNYADTSSVDTNHVEDTHSQDTTTTVDSANDGQNHIEATNDHGTTGSAASASSVNKTMESDDFFAANATLNTAIHADAKFSDIASIVGGTLSGSNSKVENDFQIHGANGNDIILNFHAATDKIVLDHGLNGSDIQDSASLFNHLSVHGNNVSIDLGLGNSITLVGVDASSLSASDFIIV